MFHRGSTGPPQLMMTMVSACVSPAAEAGGHFVPRGRQLLRPARVLHRRQPSLPRQRLPARRPRLPQGGRLLLQRRVPDSRAAVHHALGPRSVSQRGAGGEERGRGVGGRGGCALIYYRIALAAAVLMSFVLRSFFFFNLFFFCLAGAKAAPGICFQRVNSAGDPYGNCGKDSKGSFAKCEAR